MSEKETRETSKEAYKKITESLGRKKACIRCLDIVMEILGQYPDDPGVTRHEVETVANDCHSSIGRRLDDLVALGVLKENGEKISRNFAGLAAGELGNNRGIAYSPTGRPAKPALKPSGKLSSAATLKRLIEDAKSVATDCKGILADIEKNPDAYDVPTLKVSLEGLVENLQLIKTIKESVELYEYVT